MNDTPALCPGCAGEQARRYRPGAPDGRPEIISPDAAADLVVPMIGTMDREHCLAISLDTKHRMLAATTVSIGSIDHTFMAPREIFRDALLHNATAVVLAHNHPSGDPTPSRDDELITRRIGGAGEIIGIEVLDHLVVARDRWVSLARKGLLQTHPPVGVGAERRAGSYELTSTRIAGRSR